MQLSLEKASKFDMIRVFSNLTLSTIVENKYPTVGSLLRNYGTEKVEKVVSIMLNDLSESFKGVLNTTDVEELTVEITSSIYRNLSLEDIYLVCRNVKKSKLHGKLDQNKFLNALDNHLNERTDKIAQKSLNTHLSTKETVGKRSSETNLKSMREAKNWYLNYLNQKSNE